MRRGCDTQPCGLTSCDDIFIISMIIVVIIIITIIIIIIIVVVVSFKREWDRSIRP